MADEVDLANDHIQKTLDYTIKEQSKPIPIGEAGECDYCGEYFTRLIGGHCGRCRDKLKLP